MSVRRPLIVGLAIAAALALAVIAVVNLRRGAARRIYVELPSAPGVHEGSPVSYRGIGVGTVDSVGFTPERVRLRLAITRRDVPLRAQDRVRLAPMGAAGEQAIDILPGPATAPLLAPGHMLSPAWPDTVRVATPEQTDSMIRDIIRRSEAAKDSARRRAAPAPRDRTR